MSVALSGSILLTGSLNVTQGVTGSLFGTASRSTSSSYSINSTSASNAITSSNSISSSYVINAPNYVPLSGGTITGDLVVNNNLTVFGTASFYAVTASQLDVSASFISVNVFEPTQRFGGLKVYDSGSSNATASLAWDSLNNRWIYQNASGSNYSGGMLIAGPKNSGSLGSEVGLTAATVPVAQGGDHISDSNIINVTGSYVGIGVNTQVTGSLRVTAGITGSLQGTSSWASNTQTSSYLASLNQVGDVNKYTSNTIIDGYQLAWNSGSQQWAPAAGAAAKGVTRLFVSANRNNTTVFFFNSITVTADSTNTNPGPYSAFMINTALLSKITVYLREDSSTANNSVRIDITKNANGTPFTDATSSIANSTNSLNQNLISTYTFSNLTLNQFDSIHIKCTPVNAPGQIYGIVTLE